VHGVIIIIICKEKKKSEMPPKYTKIPAPTFDSSSSSEPDQEDDDDEDIDFTAPPTPAKKNQQPSKRSSAITLTKGPSSSKKKKQVAPQPQAPAVPVVPTERKLQAHADNLNNLVRQGLEPMMTFIGMLNVKLRKEDDRLLLLYKEDNPTFRERTQLVKVPESNQEKEFWLNAIAQVGKELVAMYSNTVLYDVTENVKPEPANAPAIGFNIEEFMDSVIEQEAIDPVILGNTIFPQNDVEAQFAPIWVFHCLRDSLFRAIISQHCLGAIEYAYSMLVNNPGFNNWTIKELILSTQVRHQFAFLVSSCYLSSGDTVPDNTRSQRGRNSTYLNIVRMRTMMADQIECCLTWFESVRAIPSKVRALFIQQFDQMFGADPQRRARYLKYLPERELIYMG
jgi:hypothetical protein